MIRLTAIVVLITTLLVAACSSDSGSAEETSGPVTGDQVCNLVSADDVGKALDFEVTDTTPQDDATPGCVWYYDDGTEINGVVLAVLRPEDVENNEAKEAFNYVLELNRAYGAGASEETIKGVGDQAIFMVGKNNKILIVQDKKRILTLAGQALTKDGASAIGKQAAASLK